MGFSRGQQPEFREMLNAAWGEVLREQPGAMRCKGKRCGTCDFCGWYETELRTATGKTSTTECGAGRDYDRAMAHFEGIAGTGIKWALRVHSGDAVRLLHQLGEVGARSGMDEGYLRRIARRTLRRDDLPELASLSREDLVRVLAAATRTARSQAKETPPAEVAGDDPF